MQVAHSWLGGIVIGVCSIGALFGGLRYWHGRGAGRVITHVLSLAQTLLVAQVGLGLLLLADDRRAGDHLHYLYGSLAMGAALAPWFYAPPEGPKRLLWFSGTTGLAAVLAVRAFMTGPA